MKVNFDVIIAENHFQHMKCHEKMIGDMHFLKKEIRIKIVFIRQQTRNLSQAVEIS